MRGKPAEPIVESLAVLVPPARVWAALTSARELGQLMLARVEMRAEPGAPFLWQWTLWEKMAPGRGRGRFTWNGTVLDAVPGSTLVLGGGPAVTLTVKGEGAATLVTVVHGAVLPGQRRADYEHGWADFLLRLKTHLESETLECEVLCRVLVQASPQQVYRAWLDPKALAKLLPGNAQVKAKVGGRFSWQHKRGQHVHTGAFLELQKNRKIAFTWEDPEASGRPASEVTVEAQPAPYGTLVAVHHAGLLHWNRGQLSSQRMFWARLLERLRCYFHFKGRIKSAG